MTDNELPEGWIELGFDELNSFKSKTIDPSDYPDEVFELYSVPTFPTRKPELLAGRAIGSTKQVVEPGDVLICKINPRINRVWKVMPKTDKRQIASSEWIVMRAKGMNSEFLRTYFCSQAFREILCEDLTGVGGSLTRAQPKRVAKFRVPLAPVAEQKRIAGKLEAVLGRVDACRARLDRVPDLLKRFRQSVLAAATSGQLTEDWRTQLSPSKKQKPNVAVELGDEVPPPFEELPFGWGVERAADAVQHGADIVYGIVQPGPKLSKGVPYVRGMDIENGKILIHQLLKTSPTIAERYSRSSLKGGDVLLGIIRATKVALVPDELEGANITQGTARFRPSSRLQSKFLAFALESPALQKWLHAHYRGIDMPGLNLGDVRRLPLPIPPLAEQAEIVRRVETLFALADRIEARLATAQRLVERLTPATLSKAFRGDLVPQDPNDEPASKLLERLGASTQVKSKRTKSN